MRHQGTAAGGFFLGGKAGGFTDADEELLVLFAQQAAAALANARAHREEQRARADLAALVETCPVGVAVFDAASGALLSLNREARRIVAGLGTPDGSVEQLRAALVCRRGDGREVTRRRPRQRRDGARRGGRALRPRRQERADADRRHADPLPRRQRSNGW